MVADEEMLENTIVKVEGRGEILSIHPRPSRDKFKARDKLVENYLDGWAKTNDRVELLTSFVEDILDISAK